MSPKMALLTWQAVTQLPDMRDIAESVGVPTLVLHRKHEAIPIEMGRELAAAIPGRDSSNSTVSTTFRMSVTSSRSPARWRSS